MATTLVSPGVSVEVKDESFYASSGPGTVPFILIATRENKANPSGTTAEGTLPENAGKVYTVSSSRELLDLFGAPVFPKNASGNAIYGSETAEYGLLTANSVLDVSARAYIVRADVNLDQLTATSIRPTGPVDNGTNWLDTSATSWGIFQWSAASATFTRKSPRIITNVDDQNDGPPLQSIGAIGEYAVNTTMDTNPVYFKNSMNEWVMVGSTEWQTSLAAVTGTVHNPLLGSGDSIKINESTAITLSGTTVSSLATAINNKNITGVTASGDTGFLQIFVTSEAASDGSTVDGLAYIENNSGSILTGVGIDVGYYAGPSVQLSPHTSIPAWKSFDLVPRPSGSVWVKTTSVSGGANLNIYRWSTNANKWVLQSAPLYSSDVTALRYLDPSRGGIGVSTNAIYVQYDVDAMSEITYKLWTRVKSGVTSVTGSVTNPSFTYGDTILVQASIPGVADYDRDGGGSALGGCTEVTIVSADGSSAPTATDFVTSLLSAGISYIDAKVLTGNIVQITHTAGGNILLSEGSGTALADAGITASNEYAKSYSEMGGFEISNWTASVYTADSISPVATPDDGTMWYYGTPIVADIMISDGTGWKGYRTVSTDARGFDLSLTDTNGPIISASKPTTQSDGTSTLVVGDLWIDTSDLENYPKIYRWQEVETESQWVALDVSDDTNENGVVFADARWDGDGTTNPVTDDLPSIADLLLNSYTDLDAPSHTVYPRGVLLFNTRRSSYNVKEFVANHFNSIDYAGESLPDVRDTWVSVSGTKANGVPYFGRRAVRNIVVAGLKSAIDTSEEIREDARFFNLMACPGYSELIPNMTALNTARRETAFIVGDLPMGLASDSTTLENYIINTNGEVVDSEYGLTSANTFVGVYYPSAMLTNDTTGATVAVPSSHAVLRVFVKNDNKAYPWFAPAGEQRGTIDNATSVGYINRATGSFVPVGTKQGQRDLLYVNRVNPIALFSTTGLLVYGQKTRASSSSALDRINVARLINYIRYQLEVITKPLIFEPNDKITRNEAKQIVESMLNDILAKRGLYDYLVVCDESNNTPQRIDRNELHIDVAIEPAKAVEFIYIPVRILNTGGIKAGNATAQTV